MSKGVSKITDAIGITNYGDQAKATKNATNQQLAATNAQIGYQKEADALAAQRLQPFVDLGTSNIQGLQGLLTPQGQMGYLQSNPMFQAAVQNAASQTKGAAASQGKFGSGGLVDQLFQNYLGQGEQFIGNQFNRLTNTVGMGQASAAGQAANSLNAANNITGILGNQGDIRSAGTMAGQNIQNQALGGGLNMLGGGLLGSGLLGGSGLAGGGMAGAGLGAMFFSDRRLKTDIVEIDRDDLGGIYECRYIGSDVKMVCRMADELQKTRPDAVFEHESGYLMVTSEFAPRAA
jgi:hypothetical protein